MSPAQFTEAVLFVGLGGTAIHTAMAVATRPVDVAPGAALAGGLSDVVFVAELVAIGATLVARLVVAGIRTGQAARAIAQPEPSGRPRPRRRPVPTSSRPSIGDYRAGIELAVFGPAGPIRGEVPGR